MTTVFASCSSYVLGQLFGPAEACARINDAAKHPSKPPPCFAVRALHTLTHLADVTLALDGGASHIGKSRSRHFWNALQSSCDVWVSIDDDVSASRETLAWLLAAVEGPSPVVCVAPCLLRHGDAINIEWSPVYYEKTVPPDGGSVRRIRTAGFGLVAMNRAAMNAAAKAAPTWRDLDGVLKPAPFLESITEAGEWRGEDVSFFHRLPREVERLALTSGKTLHAGHELALEILKS